MKPSGETGEAGRRATEPGDPDEPEAGDEKYVFVGDGSRPRPCPCPSSESPSPSSSATAGSSVSRSRASSDSRDRALLCGVLLREGGRGRGFERREVASRSVRFGSGFEFRVEGTGMPFALPRPLWRDTGVTGAVGKDEMGGGVEGGAGAEPLEAGSSTAACGSISVRALLASLALCGGAQIKSLLWLDMKEAAELRARHQCVKLQNLAFLMPRDLMVGRVDGDQKTALGISQDFSEVRLRIAS